MPLPVVVALVVGGINAIQAATISRLSNAINPFTIWLAGWSAAPSSVWCGPACRAYGRMWVTVARQWWWLPLEAAGSCIVGVHSEHLGLARALALVICVHLSTTLVIGLARSAVAIGPGSIMGLVRANGGAGPIRAA